MNNLTQNGRICNTTICFNYNEVIASIGWKSWIENKLIPRDSLRMAHFVAAGQTTAQNALTASGWCRHFATQQLLLPAMCTLHLAGSPASATTAVTLPSRIAGSSFRAGKWRSGMPHISYMARQASPEQLLVDRGYSSSF